MKNRDWTFGDSNGLLRYNQASSWMCKYRISKYHAGKGEQKRALKIINFRVSYEKPLSRMSLEKLSEVIGTSKQSVQTE